MPWGCPSSPCIQTGVLKSFIDRSFSGQADVKTHSPFVVIPFTTGLPGTFAKLSEYEEYPYLLLSLRRYWDAPNALRTKIFRTLLAKLNASGRAKHDLTKSALNKLEKATKDYVDGTLAPQLSESGVNLVGFTMNYAQVYASLYCARYLAERYPHLPCLFLFGGMSASFPHVAEVLKIFRIHGLGVVGEGEKKLESLVRLCVEAPESDVKALITAIAKSVPGTYDIQNNGVDLYERHKDFYKTQIAFLGDIPPPNFDGYFDLINGTGTEAPPERYAAVREVVYLPYEGTRGCFAKCDFCNLNATWEGFRKNTPENIMNNALALTEKYDTYRVQFLDNVCDTWAESYADSLIEKKLTMPAFMELRAHHPQSFWTKLALSGVAAVQIGIEMLAPELLKKIGKGTTVLQNVRVQKWLKELGIHSTSNLITHHPKSTLQDVQETLRILKLTPHLDPYTVSPFSLTLGSPLYYEFDNAERKKLRGMHWIRFPKALENHVIPNLGFATPEKWINRDVQKAWDGLVRWYKKYHEALDDDVNLTVFRLRDNKLLITDMRDGEIKQIELQNDEASVYDACHSGARPDAIAKQTGLPPERIQAVLARLTDQSLLLAVEGAYVSLALRPRDELIGHYYADMNRKAATRAFPSEESHLQTYRLPASAKEEVFPAAGQDFLSAKM
jgi:radical SAM superfamily enzyme YgiQ (UPF0313 family)